jgi:hypothetical protein
MNLGGGGILLHVVSVILKCVVHTQSGSQNELTYVFINLTWLVHCAPYCKGANVQPDHLIPKVMQLENDFDEFK